MKIREALTLIFFGGMILALPARSQEKVEGEPEKPMYRVTALFELIEIDRADWNAWLSHEENSTAGPELRKHVQELLKEENATLVETAIAVGTGAKRVVLESVAGYIFPTSGDPPELADQGTLSTHLATTACETRHTGLNLELDLPGWIAPRPQYQDAFDPDSNPSEKAVPEFTPSNIAFSRVLKIGESSYGKDESERRMPTFYSISHVGEVQFVPGQSVLVSSHRPASAVEPERKDPVVLAFLRIDILNLRKGK